MPQGWFIEIILGSVGLLGLATFVIKKLIESTINRHFNRRDVEMRSQFEVMAHLKEQLLDSLLRIYRELSKLVYQSRNLARDLSQRPDLDVVSKFNTITHDYSMTLYNVRFDLPEPLFDKVHRYKLLLLEMAEASGSRMSRTERDAAENDPSNSRIEEIYSRINSLFQEIIAELKKERENIVGVDKPGSTAVQVSLSNHHRG